MHTSEKMASEMTKARPELSISRRILAAAALAVTVTLFAGCGGNGSVPGPPSPLAGTYYGATAPFGSGTARAFIVIGSGGQPQAVGVRFAASSFAGLSNSLPTPVTPPFPPEIGMTPINNVELIYKPTGKFPPGTYDIPQISASFMYITEAQRQQIQLTGTANYNKVYKPALAPYVPPTYFLFPGSGAATFGVHYTYFENPEFVGQGFTFSTDYLYYNGQMVGIEPFVAITTLNQKVTNEQVVETPSMFPAPGYYPSRSSYGYDPTTQEYFISLEGFAKY
jgi:hypothetical protein